MLHDKLPTASTTMLLEAGSSGGTVHSTTLSWVFILLAHLPSTLIIVGPLLARETNGGSLRWRPLTRHCPNTPRGLGDMHADKPEFGSRLSCAVYNMDHARRAYHLPQLQKPHACLYIRPAYKGRVNFEVIKAKCAQGP